MIDRAGPIRSGEELDLRQLDRLFELELPGGAESGRSNNSLVVIRT
ncbi:MAG: hypothetical protein R3C56_38820 [Pirellulaceae bacterium]